MKQFIIIDAAIAVCVIAAAVVLLAGTPKTAEPVSNVVYVFDDGSAQIKVDCFNAVQQLHEDVVVGNTTYLAGTLIIPGDGSEIYYNYPRKDKAIKWKKEQKQ